MTRFIKFTAAALLSLATMPALADAEGNSVPPPAVASPAQAQAGRTYQPYSFQAARSPGAHWTGPVASPAQGPSTGPALVAGGYNNGSNG